MSNIQPLAPEKIRDVQAAADQLIKLHKSGALGNEIIPEDANPQLDTSSDENYLYFTLPMALNYQRNSYRLWESAEKTYLDDEVSDVFVPLWLWSRNGFAVEVGGYGVDLRSGCP